MGGVQTHKRMVASLEKQIAVQEKKLEQVSCLLSPKMKSKILLTAFIHFYSSPLENVAFHQNSFREAFLGLSFTWHAFWTLVLRVLIVY